VSGMYLQADAVICGFVGEVPKALGNKTAAAERSGAVGRPSKAAPNKNPQCPGPPLICIAPAVRPQAEQVFSRCYAGCRLAGHSARGTGGGRGGS